MLKSISCALLFTLMFAATLGGCGGDVEPTQRVLLGGDLFDIGISEQWEMQESTNEKRVYVHSEIEGIRLKLFVSTEDFGNPLRVLDVKSIIGRELNLKYGGVSTRVSLGGNAMIKYTRVATGEEESEMHREEWVVAKPVGHSHIARVDISLAIPGGSESDPSILSLLDVLDKQVGDARIPRG